MKEKTITIEIGGNATDTRLDQADETMASIVDALHTHDKVDISISEGIALEDLNHGGKNFLDILREICKKNSWPENKLNFMHCNLTQDRSVWPSIELSNFNYDIFLHTKEVNFKLQKDFKYTFGHFIVRSSWERLMIGSYLNANYSNKTFQTYCKSLDDPVHMLSMDVDRFLHNLSCDKKINSTILQNLSQFISKMPLEKTKNKSISTRQVDNRFGWVEGPVDSEILSWYNRIFVDIVSETTITGQSFFPTEKIARPLATRTPFLVIAAPKYIKNLKRLNFRSFRRWWNEDYDDQQGLRRIESIQRIIDDLASLPEKQLNDLYKEMQPTLEYNQKLYMETTGHKIQSVFDHKVD